MKKAYFAGGCFWCMESALRDAEGVIKAVSGYSGGEERNPKYEDVKAQRTGHRETVEIEYDEEKTSFEALLGVYLCSIDPSDGDGQFIDRGRSYTCAVYCNDGREEEITRAALGALEKESGIKPKVSVERFAFFRPAEEYHIGYSLKNPEAYKEEYRVSGREEFFGKK